MLSDLTPARTPAPARPRILVADDQQDVRVALRLLLKGDGFEVFDAASPAETLAALRERPFDVALIDLNYTRDTTSGREGLDLLAEMRAADPGLPVLVMTAWGTVDLAVEAMRRGARDFVLKPWNNEPLLHAVREGVGVRQRRLEEGSRQAVTESSTRELERAHRVQEQWQRDPAPGLPTLRCATVCLQAGQVGGDACEVIALGAGRIGLLLADASGKGVSGALLVATLRGVLYGQWAMGLADPLHSLATTNQAFWGVTPPEGYASLFLGIYSETERNLEYVNCGHPAPMLRRRDGEIERLGSTGPVLGLLEEWIGTVGSCRMEAGDILVAFSDGVSEARGQAGGEYGEQRLVTLLRDADTRDADPQTVADMVLTDVRRHLDGGPGDDLTLFVTQGV